MKKEKLQWHPAFTAALRVTFQEEMQYLELLEEYPLSKNPPRIDAIILKKNKKVVIQKRSDGFFGAIILLSINRRKMS